MSCDAYLVCAFELRRQFHGRQVRRFAICAALATACVALALFAIDAWMPPKWSWEVAARTQPVGLGPQLPNVQLQWVIPFWSVWPGYLVFSWMIFIVLLGSRVYLAVRVATLINSDRTSGHEQSLRLAQLSPKQILMGRLVAVILPPTIVVTAMMILLWPRASCGGAPSYLPLRVWADAVGQFVAVAMLCFALASLFRRSSTVLAVTCVASLFGVSGLFGLFNWNLKFRTLSAFHSEFLSDWQSYAGAHPSRFPFVDLEMACYWIPILALTGCGYLIALRDAREIAIRRSLTACAASSILATILLFFVSYRVVGGSSDPTDPTAPNVITNAKLCDLDNVVRLIARKRYAEALTILQPYIAREDAEHDAVLLSAWALFGLDRFAEASLQFRKVPPIPPFPQRWITFAGICMAEGKRPLARESMRFAGKWYSPPSGFERRDAAGTARQIYRNLDSIKNGFVDELFDVVFLRWAVERFPEHAELRRELRDQLRKWANLKANTSINFQLTRLTPEERAVIRWEADEHDAKLQPPLVPH